MSRVLRPALITLLALAGLLALAPVALADPWAGCGPHALEDQVVRVFPRTPSSAGPAGDTATLQCGNRYYGLRRIEAEWAGAPGDWRAGLDAAVARALTTVVAPTWDARGGHWLHTTPEVEVVLGPRGVVVDVRPPRHP